MSSGRLGELLVRENLISVQQLRKAQEEQQKNGTRIGSALIKVGAIEEHKLTDFLSKQYGVPAINLKDFEIDPEIVKLVKKDVAQKHLVIPVNRAGQSLIVAMCDPSNIYAVDDLKFTHRVQHRAGGGLRAQHPRGDREATTRRRAPRSTRSSGQADEQVEVTEEADDEIDVKAAEDAPVVKLVNLILVDAIRKGASDIHVEPYEKDFRVRFRIDGVLYDVMKPPMKLKNAITRRLKIMASLDISERRLPQDGRIKIKIRRQGDGLPGQRLPHALRREGGAPAPGQVQPPAGHDQAGVRRRAPEVVQGGDRPALRDGAGHRSHRLGEDHHALLGARRR